MTLKLSLWHENAKIFTFIFDIVMENHYSGQFINLTHVERCEVIQ